MPYVFVRETLQCKASGLDTLAAIHQALRQGPFEGSGHAARFQANYRNRPRLRSFVIGYTTAQASGCSILLKFYITRATAKLLLVAGLLLTASSALHIWPATGLAAVVLAGLTIKAGLEMRHLSTYFYNLVANGPAR